MPDKLNDFLGKMERPAADRPQGIEWFAAVNCQFCYEPVDRQMLYPTDKVLTWTCSQGHKSFMENYGAF